MHEAHSSMHDYVLSAIACDLRIRVPPCKPNGVKKMIEAAEIAVVASPARYTKIEVRPIPGPIGAQVRCGDLTSLSDDAVEQIRRAWSDHLVLLFRGQPLDDEQLLAFTARFGALEKGPVTSVGMAEQRHNPYVCVVSNVIENGQAIGSLGDGEA